MTPRTLTVAILFGAVAASGACNIGKPPSTGGAAGGKCGPEAVLDDCEDGDSQVKVQQGRAGYAYVYADEETTVTPAADGDFTMSSGGANGTRYAAHISGKTGAKGDVYAGIGFNFVDPKGPHDLSKYAGVSFWAKVGAGSTAKVRVKIPDANTDEDGKICSDCYNDFGVNLTLTTEWKQYAVGFEEMQQQADWGKPRPSELDAARAFGLQFAVSDPGAAYDLWVDEIAFTGC